MGIFEQSHYEYSVELNVFNGFHPVVQAQPPFNAKYIEHSSCLIIRRRLRSVGKPVADECAHTVIIGTETAQLNLFGVLDFLGVTVTPFHRHFRVGIGINEHVECAISVQHGEERNRRSDLAEYGLNLFLYFFFWLLSGFCCLGFGIAVRKVGCQSICKGWYTASKAHPGAAFSLSPDLLELLLFDDLPKISTCKTLGSANGAKEHQLSGRTSNCHRSTCSPVSLSVMTTTSFEIFPPTIHLFNCDMIFLMYPLT